MSAAIDKLQDISNRASQVAVNTTMSRPVSYTHLDVYKRQVYSEVTKKHPELSNYCSYFFVCEKPARPHLTPKTSSAKAHPRQKFNNFYFSIPVQFCKVSLAIEFLNLLTHKSHLGLHRITAAGPKGSPLAHFTLSLP